MDGQPLNTKVEEELNELANRLGFHVEKPTDSDDQAPQKSGIIKVIVLLHQNDAVQWVQLRRHLTLLRLPTHQLNWSAIRLGSETLVQEQIRTQLAQADLVVLLESIDLIEGLVKKDPGVYHLMDALQPRIFPVQLRPVFWSRSFPTLSEFPEKAISQWGKNNQEAARVAVARRCLHVLQGIQPPFKGESESQG